VKISGYMTAAALAVLTSVGANAAPIFEVTDNPGGQVLPAENVNDGGTYGTTLGEGDSASINVDAQGSSLSGSLFFTLDPVPIKSTIDVILSSFDFADFGATIVSLSDGVNSYSDTVSAAGDEVVFSLKAT
jgi:hypothetical protein